jgi:hypothetical protein
MELGPASELLLVGGGRALEVIACSADAMGYKVYWATSPRYFNNTKFPFSVSNNKFPDSITISCSNVLEEAVDKLQMDSKVARINLALGNPWLLTRSQLDQIFGGVLLNCHGTGLPRDKGGGGFSWRILESNPFGFVNLYLVDEGIDSGPILEYEEFLFPTTCSVPSDYENFYFEKVIDFILKNLSLLQKSRVSYTPKLQAAYLTTYWPRLNCDVNGWVDWTMNCSELERFIRAFDDPYGRARTLLRGKNVRIGGVHLNFSDGKFHPFQSGIVYRKGPKWLCIAANGGALVAEELTDDNGDSLLDQVRLGDRLYTPDSLIEGNTKRHRLNP